MSYFFHSEKKVGHEKKIWLIVKCEKAEELFFMFAREIMNGDFFPRFLFGSNKIEVPQVFFSNPTIETN